MPRLRASRPTVAALWAAAVLGAAWLLGGCNLFSPMASDGNGDLNYRGLILKGSQAINDGDYASARDWFERAIKLNHRGSEGYLFHAKALASLYKIDYNTLNTEFNAHRAKDGVEGKRGIPFIDSTTTIEKIDSTYYPVAQSVEDLEHILRRENDTVIIPGGWKMLPDGDTASDGRVSEGVARLDLGLLQTIKGMLGPLDLDGDNHVSRDCGANICPEGGRTDAQIEACRAADAYKSKCKEGPASELNGFERFKQLTRSIDIDNLDTKDVRAKQVSSNPNDINDFLDKMQGPIAASSSNLDTVTGAMKLHQEDKLSGQLDNIVTDVGNLSDFLGYMRYNDQIDNDFDAAGASGRMVWHDYNKDGGILFDYDDSLTFIGYNTPEPNGECVNIGHPLHRHLHPELYVKFTDPEWTSRMVAGDTSKNSRKGIMIKHCVEVAGKLQPNGAKVDDALILKLQTGTCSTYTSILKPTVHPPARSDWVGGTFGIDEEEFDDRDNDYDGLKDEDARNAPGMDDDDDGNLSILMIGKTGEPSPMVWHDVAGHGNGCADIDTLQAMPSAPFQRRFCIGSLEHRIYLAQHFQKDSIKAYYSVFTGNSESGNANCLEDFKKLPQAYKTAAQQESNPPTEHQFALDVDLACQYKHIWKTGIHPPNSEWTSGTYGVDEEIPDGIDNDGDGWIDEDVRQ